MFDAVVSSVSCLIGQECDLQGAGGATPPANLIITTVAAGSIALLVSVWNDAIKDVLKRSKGNLLAATVLLFAALAVPSLLLAGLAAGVLSFSAAFRNRIWGKSLKLGKSRLIPLPRLILPTASAVYAIGAVVISGVAYLAPPPPGNDKTVAFFAPSKLIGTSLEDVDLEEQSRLLSEIDLVPKQLISGTLADLDIEFHPSFQPAQHVRFRDNFGHTTITQLDRWLSQDEELRRLSEEVDIALFESAKIQSASGKSRELVVRAYINRRSPEEGRFYRVTSGDSIVAHGTVANRNDLMLVLAVRLAAKLINELNLPPLTPEQKTRVWRDFSQALRDQMEMFLDFNESDPPTEVELGARKVLSDAADCDTALCALETAAAFEELLIPARIGDAQLSTASAAWEAAIGQ